MKSKEEIKKLVMKFVIKVDLLPDVSKNTSSVCFWKNMILIGGKQFLKNFCRTTPY